MAFGSKKHIQVIDKLATLHSKLFVWKGPIAEHIAKDLFEACMQMLTPHMSEEEAVKLLDKVVKDSTVDGNLLFREFDDNFLVALHSLGIDPKPLTKEADMSDKKESRVKALVAKIHVPNLKTIGKGVGIAAQAVVKPVLKFTDGVSEGWTSKEKPERS